MSRRAPINRHPSYDSDMYTAQPDHMGQIIARRQRARRRNAARIIQSLFLRRRQQVRSWQRAAASRWRARNS